ncbi:MAG: MFS transporter [Proteobacteria bacterium]|nr:MFS transporter [Pseudomonadota bacterium]
MLVFLTVPLSGISVDIYVPSLPAVSHYFFATTNLSQFTITAYLIGLGFTQLFAGSFSDSFGRKKMFIVAMATFILVTFLIPWSQSIYQLIFLRFLQGASLAMAVVPMRSVISDLFEGKELQKMMTYMTIAWSFGPIVAPAIGGYLQYYFGWKANFYFLGIYSLATLILAFIFLSETSAHQHPFQVSYALNNYRRMLLNPEYLNSITIGGLLFSLITLFGIVGSFFIQTVLHYTAAQFGQVTLLMGLAWFFGAMMNRFILHISLEKKARGCFWSMLIVSLPMFFTAIIHPMTIYNLIVPMIFLFFFTGMLYPSYFIRSVLLFRSSSASANALFNSSAFFIAGIISGLGTFIRLSTELPFVGVLMSLICLCLILYYPDTTSKKTMTVFI